MLKSAKRASPDSNTRSPRRAPDDKRALIPAVTHVDGSGRLQTVERRANPRYHALIEAFRGAQTSHLADAMDGRGALDYRIHAEKDRDRRR